MFHCFLRYLLSLYYMQKHLSVSRAFYLVDSVRAIAAASLLSLASQSFPE